MREDDRENNPSPDLDTPALAQSTVTSKVHYQLSVRSFSGMTLEANVCMLATKKLDADDKDCPKLRHFEIALSDL